MNVIAPPIPLKSRIAGIFLLTLLSSIIYFNSLQGAFQFDDRNLLRKEWLANLESFEKAVRLDSFQNRPILLWTFAANNQLDAKNTFGFHLVNLTIHIMVAILIFTILIRIQLYGQNKDFYEKENDKQIKNQTAGILIFPFAVAVIFAMHPVNTDSVSYISSRSTLLGTFFYLFTIYMFTEMMDLDKSYKHKIPLGLLLVTCAYLAIASKLITVTLPIIMIIWFVAFFSDRYFASLATRIFSIKAILIFSGIGIIFIGFSNSFNFLYAAKDQGLELFGRIPYLMVQAKVTVFYYLKIYFFPFNLNVDTGFPFSQFSKDWTILFCIVFIFGIFLIAFKFTNLWIQLGLVWFFLTLVPTSTLVPLNDLAVEHRMYLPMTLGLCLATGWFISKSKKTIQIHFLIYVLLVCGLLTMTRNSVWISEINLWSDSVEKNPHSPRVHNNLGKAFYEMRDLATARIHLEKSVSIIPSFIKKQYNIRKTEKISGKANFAEPHYNLGSIYLDLGQLDAAEIEYQKALVLKPDYYSAELAMGSVKNLKGQYDLAIDHFLNSITLMRKATGKNDYALARLNLGEVYGKTQKLDQAINELRRAVEIEPSMIEAHYNLGTAYMLKSNYEEAERSFRTSLVINSDYVPALFNLAQVYQYKKLWKQSNKIFEKFIKVKGPDVAVYSAMGWNNMQVGNNEQAIIDYKQVLKIKPNHQIALINLAKIYYRLDQNKISSFYLERAKKLNLSDVQISELDKLLE